MSRVNSNLVKFNQKVRQLVEVTGRVLPTELNRQLLQVVVGAKGVQGLVQLTAKATEQRIRADLNKVVTYSLKGGQIFTSRLSRVLAAQSLKDKGQRITKEAIAQMELRIIAARVRSRAYIAASWLWAAQKLALSVPGHTLNRIMDSKTIPVVSEGTAHDAFEKTTAAKQGFLRATIFNTARGAETVAQKAVAPALSRANRSMSAYIKKKLSQQLAAKWFAISRGP